MKLKVLLALVLAFCLSSLAASGACTQYAAGLWGEWRFNEADTTPDDSSVNGRGAVMSGSAVYNTTECVEGAGCYRFTGGYFTTNGTFDTTQPHCMFVWTRIDNGAANDQIILSQGDAGGYSYAAHITTDRYRVYDSVSSYDATVPFQNKAWYLTGYCHDGTKLSLYKNGTRVMYENEHYSVNDQVDMAGLVFASQFITANMDLLMIFDTNYSDQIAVDLFNNGVPCDPLVVVVPDIQFMYPDDYARNDYTEWEFIVNVTNSSCDYVELWNASQWVDNLTSGIAQDANASLYHNITSDGNYTYQARCSLSSALYNTTVLHVQRDTLQPTVTYYAPLVDNSSIFTNGTSIWVNITGSDANLYSFNVTGYLPNGSQYFTNYSVNLSSPYNFLRYIDLNVSGNYSLYSKWADSHNDLASPLQQARVASYRVVDAPDGKTLKAYHNDISVTSKDGAVDLVYNGKSWSQVIDLGSSMLGGAKVRVDVETTKPITPIDSVYPGHMVSGDNYIDFFGIDAAVSLERVTDYHYIAWLTLGKPQSVLAASSIGELNIHEAWIVFLSNSAPVITFFQNITRNVSGSWYSDFNASDAENGVLYWYVNDTNVSINISSGLLSGSVGEGDVGTHYIRVNVTDGLLWDTEYFAYSYNVSMTSVSYTFDQFECDMSTTGKAIGFVGIILIMVLVWMFGLFMDYPVLNFATAFIMFWSVTWQVAACFQFGHLLFMMMGFVALGKAVMGVAK